MQAPTIEKVPGSKVKLAFIVTPDEAQPYITQSVEELSISKSIPGFRPGKAPYAEIVKAFGEMRIWENALERIVRARYMHAVLENDLDIVGSPEIQVDQLTPNQDIKFTIIAPTAPIVESIADYTKERATYSAKTVSEEEVAKALDELRKMQRKEVASLEPTTEEDAIVIDLEMTKDNVILEDGVAHGYRIYLSEPHYIPGFSDHLVGMKEGEEKTFSLPFPSEHYQKHLAGKDVDFKVKATGVFKLELPPLDDAFAQSLGQKTLEDLRKIVEKNMNLEEEQRNKDKSEIELLEKLVDESRFSDIAELLVNEETIKMMKELESSIDERGMKFEDYLASIKKTRDELKLEFTPQAIRRIKTATLIKEVAKKENIHVEDKEVEAEIDHILSGIREEDKETRDRVSSPEYHEYVAIVMRNRKALDFLRKHGIKDYPADHECEDEHCGHQH